MVSIYIMRCRGMSSAVTLIISFLMTAFTASPQRKFILTSCMMSKQVIIQQVRTTSTDAKARPQNYTNKLLLKSESHYKIKERPTKIFTILFRDHCALIILKFLPTHRQSVITSTLLSFLFKL